MVKYPINVLSKKIFDPKKEIRKKRREEVITKIIKYNKTGE
jgi:hypothetical protein